MVTSNVVVDEILDDLSCKSVFLVADALAYESYGAKRSLDKVLASRRHAVFSDFRPNPDLDQLLPGLRSYAIARLTLEVKRPTSPLSMSMIAIIR